MTLTEIQKQVNRINHAYKTGRGINGAFLEAELIEEFINLVSTRSDALGKKAKVIKTITCQWP
jgi:hypothetical protein